MVKRHVLNVINLWGVLTFGSLLGCGSCDAGAVVPEPRRSLEEWRADLRHDVIVANIPDSIFDEAMKGFEPDDRIIIAAKTQPELTVAIEDYLERAVSSTRIATGQNMIAHHRDLFDRLETHYGVDRYILAAIWGIETSYGKYQGRYNVVHALATLDYEGRRRTFARKQLIAALQILNQGHIAPEHMKGSWAGAMGHPQFIPTSYHAYAQDFDGVEGEDIWGSIPDALASAANYLKKSGWRTGQPWGYEVHVPEGFEYSLADSVVHKNLQEWDALGVSPYETDSEGRVREHTASLFLPAGHRGPAFLTFDNFRVILRYNNSTSYALAVGHLADRLRGRDIIRGRWPDNASPLKREERKTLQRLLSAQGYDIGAIDGIIGTKTRAAIRHWQKAHGEPADGFPTVLTLNKIKND
ncbi:MAG: lytic murein transglycosylase [Parvularculales bacterium]